ncbi:MAG: leucyl/phenylalanyl-tRNA--protein transferase [Bdellovibrionales bacterium]|nr:leucyl/phenylalanyl-tRNA--protein transferase [Bdellovibrionales bacterium]
MVIKRFPPVESADEYGLLAVGGDVEVESLLCAYRSGVFPWPIYKDILTWFCPPERAILRSQDLHVSRSLKKFLKKLPYSIYVNRNFEQVIKECSAAVNRTGQQGTWISSELIAGYINLHRAGYAHSIECYDGNALVGGLYGVSIGKMFAGESMFYRADNASKVCLLYLMQIVAERGAGWIDCQVVTSMTEAFGAVEVSRESFLELLRPVVSSPGSLFDSGELDVTGCLH